MSFFDDDDGGLEDVNEYGYSDEQYGIQENPFDPFSEWHFNTKEDWFNEVTYATADTLFEDYGMDRLEIIRALEAEGVWDAEDWDDWRELYGEQ